MQNAGVIGTALIGRTLAERAFASGPIVSLRRAASRTPAVSAIRP